MIKLNERALFTLILAAYAGLMLHLTLNLSPVARLVPLIVVIPTLGLLVFQLVLDLVPWLERKYKRFEKADLLGVQQIKATVLSHDQPNSVNAGDPAERSRRELKMLVWIALLPCVISLLGFQAALPAYTLLYLRGRAGESWMLSITVAAAMAGLLVGVFSFALRGRLYEGQLWSWLGW
jgi:hypothetical protein